MLEERAGQASQHFLSGGNRITLDWAGLLSVSEHSPCKGSNVNPAVENVENSESDISQNHNKLYTCYSSQSPHLTFVTPTHTTTKQ